MSNTPRAPAGFERHPKPEDPELVEPVGRNAAAVPKTSMKPIGSSTSHTKSDRLRTGSDRLPSAASGVEGLMGEGFAGPLRRPNSAPEFIAAFSDPGVGTVPEQHFLSVNLEAQKRRTFVEIGGPCTAAPRTS
jgi:hypothetical protein